MLASNSNIFLPLLLLLTLSSSASIFLSSPAQTVYHNLVSLTNLREITSFNLNQSSFQLGPNHFLHLTPSQFTSIYSSSTPTLPSPQVSLPLIGAIISLLPSNKSVDWRQKGIISSVKNQGQICSSCYAFTAVADIETTFLLAQQKKLDLSEQQIVDCSSAYGNNGCTNGFYGYAFDYVIKTKLSLQQNYPYRGSVQSCLSPSSTGYQITSYTAYNGNSCAYLQSKLQTRPAVVSLDGVNFYWQFYTNGVLNQCGSREQLNHGVQIVGVENREDGTGWWVAKNSWGTQWGENGYIRLSKAGNGNICGICSFIYHSNL